MLTSAVTATPATFTHICTLSKSVMGLTLKILDKTITFKPGQWLDMAVPGIEGVTGYSMTSSPRLLRQQGLLQLAVKYSDHPITDWLHRQCAVGSEVKVQIGGDFFYVHDSKPVLLIAGGLGINPLYSIINSITEDVDADVQAVTLLYSASSTDELIFMKELKQLERDHANLSCQFFVTQAESSHTSITCGRISAEEVSAAVGRLPAGVDARCYVCGPPAMIDSMEAYAKQSGLTEVYSERWWSQDDLTH